ncbi:stalk domain-containing protein [Desulfotomaculum sp. 1211_IL3151]|uniref:stalk domain-containing protein n=1 Tax=Desulfotomaculum sp. 1211_IL3151 TaxID=3084055 RepID=UPI002FD9E343
MKRFLCLITLVLFTLFSVPASFANAAQPMSVFVNGAAVKFDVPPMVQENRTLVPFRALAEALQVEVTWDGASQTIRAKDAVTYIVLQIGNKTANHNDSDITLDVPPQIINGRTLIPLRFFSEAFDCQVSWNASENTIHILSAPRQIPWNLDVVGYYALGDLQTSSWTNLFGQPFPDHSSANTDVVNDVALGWYSLDRDGNLLTKSRTGWQRPEDYEKVLAAADQYDLKTQMVIHMADEDSSLTDLLASKSATEQAVQTIAEEAVNYQSVNLDFEGLGLSETNEQLTLVQNRFTNFVALLAKELKNNGIKLSLSLHAPNSAYKGYDYASLGKLADSIIIMAYDYGSKPEPKELVNGAVQAALKEVPAGKLYLGISIPNETSSSLVDKLNIAKQHRLKGIAIWRLGLVTPDMWQTLRENTTAS